MSHPRFPRLGYVPSSGFPLLPSSVEAVTPSLVIFALFRFSLLKEGRFLEVWTGLIQFHSFPVSSSQPRHQLPSLDVGCAVHQELSEQARGKAGRAVGLGGSLSEDEG